MMAHDDPFEDELIPEDVLHGPVPPEAGDDPDKRAADELIASAESADDAPDWADVPDEALGLE